MHIVRIWGISAHPCGIGAFTIPSHLPPVRPFPVAPVRAAMGTSWRDYLLLSRQAVHISDPPIAEIPLPPAAAFPLVQDNSKSPPPCRRSAGRCGPTPSARCAPRPSAAPRRCRPRIRSSSRCRTPARPNGIARTPPGSSSSFCSRRMLSGYRAFDERFAYLFNSYYVAAGPRHARPERGLITRPNAQEVAAYRAHVDRAVSALIEGADDALLDKIVPIVEIGLNHEQQHQELMWTDILHAFAQNPTSPAYDTSWQPPARRTARQRVCRSPGRHLSDRPRRRRFLLRQRAAGASGAAARRRDRAASRHQRRMARIHRRRRLRDAVALAVGRLGRGRGARLERAGLLAQRRRRLAFDDARRPAGRSIRRRRSCTSAITRPTPSRAGPASTCRPSPNGRSRRAPALLADAVRRGLAVDAQRLSPHIRAIAPPKARSANTTASS